MSAETILADLCARVAWYVGARARVAWAWLRFSGRNWFDSVRFGSENAIFRFDAVRPAFFGRVVARSGSVRFGVRKLKLARLVNLGGSWHEKLTLLVTHFSLPISACPFQGHPPPHSGGSWLAPKPFKQEKAGQRRRRCDVIHPPIRQSWKAVLNLNRRW